MARNLGVGGTSPHAERRPRAHDVFRASLLRSLAASAAARILVEKHHISLGELTDRLAEVKARYEGGLAGKTVGGAATVRG